MSRASRIAVIALAASPMIFALACGKTQASAGSDVKSPPPGQVWLTPLQVKDAKIESAPLAEQNIDDTILTSGKVTFDDQRVSHVYSPVTGRVVRIDAALGQQVTKGQTLAVIQSPDIGAASSDLGKAKADLVMAEHDLARKKELYEAKAGSLADLQLAQDSFGVKKAEYDRAQQKAVLLRTGGNVDSVVSGFALTAGLDGEVIARNVSPGIEVQGQYGGGSAVELFTVGQLDKVWVLADVYEIDIAHVKVGSKAIVKVVAYPDKIFQGKVDWVAGMLDPVTRTARVRCTFDNPDRMLKPEMYATVAIAVEQKKALAINRSSLLRLGDTTVVFIQNGQTPEGKLKYERIPITVDEGEASEWLPIAHVLEPGTKVVTAGAVLLSGML